MVKKRLNQKKAAAKARIQMKSKVNKVKKK
jgi:hypothetical protein